MLQHGLPSSFVLEIVHYIQLGTNIILSPIIAVHLPDIPVPETQYGQNHVWLRSSRSFWRVGLIEPQESFAIRLFLPDLFFFITMKISPTLDINHSTSQDWHSPHSLFHVIPIDFFHGGSQYMLRTFLSQPPGFPFNSSWYGVAGDKETATQLNHNCNHSHVLLKRLCKRDRQTRLRLTNKLFF